MPTPVLEEIESHYKGKSTLQKNSCNAIPGMGGGGAAGRGERATPSFYLPGRTPSMTLLTSWKVQITQVIKLHALQNSMFTLVN